MEEHAVIVTLKLSNAQFGAREEREAMHALQDALAAAIAEHEAGEFDGDDFGQGECTLFMYGPDADRLFEAIREPLLASALSRGGHAIKRYGPPKDGVPEVRVDFDAA
jgi:hypothetical protein